MTGHVTISSHISVIAHEGTLYVTWPDGTTTAEDEDEVGPLLRSCRRPRPAVDLKDHHGPELVARLLRQGLLVTWQSSDVLSLHEATLGADLAQGAPAAPFDLAYDDARLHREYGSGQSLDLPNPSAEAGTEGLRDLLAARSSARAFTGAALSLEDLSTLVALALGSDPSRSVRPRVTGGPPARPAYPSPGALYPVELSVLAWDISDLPPGAYRYQPVGHRLSRTGDLVEADADRLAADTAHGAASLLVLWTDLLSATFAKYGAKGYRLMLLEAGHIMQNLVLVATALDLPALPVAGFRDREVARAVGLSAAEQVPVYGLLLGGHP